MTARRIYIAGAGVIARTHARAVETLSDSADTTVHVADPDPDALGAFESEFPDARAYDDVDAMLDEPAEELDIVVVATPPFTHEGLALDGLRSGRNVLCEKPLAMDCREAENLLSAAREHDRLLGSCACRFLGSEPLTRVANYLRAGDLGDVYHLTFVDRLQRQRTGIEYQPGSRWFLDASKSGGGVLMDWGPYDVAVLTALLDPDAVDVEHAWTANPKTGVDLPDDVVFDTEHHVGAAFQFHHGDRTAPVTYERAGCTHGEADSRFEIEGTEGAVAWTWKGMGPGDEMRVTRRFDVDGEVESETERFVHEGRPTAMDRPLYYFDRVVRGESAPIPTNRGAVDNFACLRAVYDSARTGEPQSVAFGGEQ